MGSMIDDAIGNAIEALLSVNIDQAQAVIAGDAEINRLRFHIEEQMCIRDRVMAAREFGDAIVLVGDRARVEAELAAQDTSGLKIEVRHAAQAIGMKDSPSAAAREKRDSSMHVGLALLRSGEVDAFVSAGNTGAILAVATLRQTGVGRIPGVLRPAMGVIFPIESKPLLIDND